MGIPGSIGHGPPRSAPRGAGRSIRSYLAIRLTVPAVCLVLVWAAIAGAVFAGALHGVIRQSAHRALDEAIVVAGSGLLVAVIVLVLIWFAASRLAREAAVAAGALATMQAAATTAADAEARLRGGFRQVLTSLGRRNQSLLQRQLRIIDALEQQAVSPAALADLFALDHLTTRMRRHAESLTVLSGTPAARPRIGPVSVVDVIRAAVAETEDYKRVVVRTETDEVVASSAVTDMIHLLAELIENATLFSPSATRVEVRAERVANGFAIEVEDRGLGIAADQLADLNARLAHPPDFDVVDADRLGLFVAGLLAARHRIEVSLGPSPYRGTKAIVLLPDDLVLPATDADGGAGAARLRSTNALSLIGAATSPTLPEPRQGGDEPAAQPATTSHGLPRRVRPEPQPAIAEEDRQLSPGRPDAPAPDDARRLAASLQRSWHRSRANEGQEPDEGQQPDQGREAGEVQDEEKRNGW